LIGFFIPASLEPGSLARRNRNACRCPRSSRRGRPAPAAGGVGVSKRIPERGFGGGSLSASEPPAGPGWRTITARTSAGRSVRHVAALRAE